VNEYVRFAGALPHLPLAQRALDSADAGRTYAHQPLRPAHLGGILRSGRVPLRMQLRGLDLLGMRGLKRRPPDMQRHIRDIRPTRGAGVGNPGSASPPSALQPKPSRARILSDPARGHLLTLDVWRKENTRIRISSDSAGPSSIHRY